MSNQKNIVIKLPTQTAFVYLHDVARANSMSTKINFTQLSIAFSETDFLQLISKKEG